MTPDEFLLSRDKFKVRPKVEQRSYNNVRGIDVGTRCDILTHVCPARSIVDQAPSVQLCLKVLAQLVLH